MLLSTISRHDSYEGWKKKAGISYRYYPIYYIPTQFLRKLISSAIVFVQQTDKEVHYIEALVNDGAKIPIDADVGSYEICLPPWYDEEKFKR